MRLTLLLWLHALLFQTLPFPAPPFAVSGGGGATPALIAHTACWISSLPSCTTPGIATNTSPPASLLVAYVGTGPGTPANTWISDSLSNTWSSSNCTTVAAGMGYNGILCFVPNPTVGSSQTFSCTQLYFGCDLAVAAFSGVLISSPLDSSNYNNGTTSPFQAGSITLGTNELAVVGITANTTDAMASVGSSFTITDTIGEGTYGWNSSLAYWVGSGAVNPSWTLNLNVADVVGSIASFHHQ